jgi:hypothetical protein
MEFALTRKQLNKKKAEQAAQAASAAALPQPTEVAGFPASGQAGVGPQAVTPVSYEPTLPAGDQAGSDFFTSGGSGVFQGGASQPSAAVGSLIPEGFGVVPPAAPPSTTPPPPPGFDLTAATAPAAPLPPGFRPSNPVASPPPPPGFDLTAATAPAAPLPPGFRPSNPVASPPPPPGFDLTASTAPAAPLPPGFRPSNPAASSPPPPPGFDLTAVPAASVEQAGAGGAVLARSQTLASSVPRLLDGPRPRGGDLVPVLAKRYVGAVLFVVVAVLLILFLPSLRHSGTTPSGMAPATQVPRAGLSTGRVPTGPSASGTGWVDGGAAATGVSASFL